MRTRLSAAILAASVSLALLTGCSSSAPKPEPTATKSVAAPDGVEKPAYDNACDGTQAVISGDGGKHELTKSCDAVSVVSSGSKIALDTTKSLMVEGSNNTITVKSTETVTLFGSNNKIRVTDGKPDVDDQGTGNAVD